MTAVAVLGASLLLLVALACGSAAAQDAPDDGSMVLGGNVQAQETGEFEKLVLEVDDLRRQVEALKVRRATEPLSGFPWPTSDACVADVMAHESEFDYLYAGNRLVIAPPR